MNIQWTKISHDVNGNPRYVCHFFALLKDSEKALPNRYEIAVKRANRIGGRKFHNRQFGGGVVFQSYSIKDTEESIRKALEV